MTRKVRKRGMLLSLLAAGLLLLVFMLSVGTMSYHQMLNRLDRSIQRKETAFLWHEAKRDGDQSVWQSETGEQNDNRDGAGDFGEPYALMAVFDKDGDLIRLMTERDVKPDAATKDRVFSAYRSGKTEGFCDQYRFRKTYEEDQTRILLLNASNNLQQFRDLCRGMLVLAIIAFAVFFVVMGLLAQWMVRPYFRSYDSQKRFITNASHDLKTPLTVIRADAAVLESLDPSNRWVKDIQKQSGKIAELIDDLLLLSRMQEAEWELAWVDFPVSDIVEEEAQQFINLAEASGRDYSYHVQAMLSYRGDARAIRHLVDILLDNAFKYSTEPGLVELTLRERGQSLVLSVYNTVNYIAREEIPKLTERFYRGDQSRNAEANSYGLGLAVADEIVRMHGGSMDLRTKDEHSFQVTIRLRYK